MCGPVPVTPILGVASAGMQLMGARRAATAHSRQGYADINAAYHNAEMREYEAQIMKERAIEQTKKIAVEAERMRSTQTAQHAASGIVIGEGSAQIMRDHTTNLAQQDALIAMYNAADGHVGKIAEADNLRRAGHSAFIAAQERSQAAMLQGTISAVGTLYHTFGALSAKR